MWEVKQLFTQVITLNNICFAVQYRDYIAEFGAITRLGAGGTEIASRYRGKITVTCYRDSSCA